MLGQAAGAEADEAPGWIPSVNVGFDTFSYDADATAENHLNPPAHEATQTEPSTQAEVQLGAGLMSPMLALPGRPRLFVQGGAQFGPFSSDRIFKTGDLNADPEFDIKFFQTIRDRDIKKGCQDLDPPTCLTADEGEFEGQGGEIDAKIQGPSWYAALGVAFEIPVANSLLLRVKPSVAYNLEKVDLSGQLTTVIETPPPPDEDFEVRRGAASESTTEHSLGCGLELGLVLSRSARPVTTSLYADARFLWALGDTTTTFSASDPDGLVATFTADREGFVIRGGAGVRFSWLGFSGR
jgi:hypothetical protein